MSVHNEGERRVWSNGRKYKILAGLVVAAVLIAAFTLVYVLTSTDNKVNGTDSRLQAQIEGRQIAVRATCEIQRSIIDAGISSIKSGVLLPGDQVDDNDDFIPGQLTKQLGKAFPSYPERVIAADKAAAAYEDRIATAVIKAAGGSSRVLTNRKLDCHKLAVVSNASTTQVKGGDK